ncbi:MAG: hypothetical protein IJ523_08795 [Succinivibrionaceae bacterium]|nr:hypothetical protein [Succinivibrionaceae bacterium]MBQ8708171.1 hypothetical protein [Succinivibrionaceae bacterium]
MGGWKNEHGDGYCSHHSGYYDNHSDNHGHEEGLNMGDMREALWSKLQDIDHSLAALEAVTRALAGAGSMDAADMDNVMWHIAESLQSIRADVDDSTAMVQMMKGAA